jgi:hypothetical protein
MDDDADLQRKQHEQQQQQWRYGRRVVSTLEPISFAHENEPFSE